MHVYEEFDDNLICKKVILFGTCRPKLVGQEKN